MPHGRRAEHLLSALPRRVARRKALGYRKIITYTLPEEGGGSLRATGFSLVGEAGGGRWNRPGRPASDTHPIGKKLRWELAC
jgi:hypothetical protein